MKIWKRVLGWIYMGLAIRCLIVAGTTMVGAPGESIVFLWLAASLVFTNQGVEYIEEARALGKHENANA